MMLLLSVFFTAVCAHHARQAFEAGRNVSGWFSLMVSAFNAAVVLLYLL
jgi:hypothetical protein